MAVKPGFTSPSDIVSQVMTEILFGIRVIKFYTWESHFAQKVAECRKEELSHLRAIKYLDALCVYTWAALPVVISITTFVTYVLLGNQLTAAKVSVDVCDGTSVCFQRLVQLLWSLTKVRGRRAELWLLIGRVCFFDTPCVRQVFIGHLWL